MCDHSAIHLQKIFFLRSIAVRSTQFGGAIRQACEEQWRECPDLPTCRPGDPPLTTPTCLWWDGASARDERGSPAGRCRS